MRLRLRAGTATSIGLHRQHNEDDLLSRGNLYAVADGMGGHAAGAVAARLAVEALRTVPGDGLVTEDALIAAIAEGHAEILRTAAARGHARMGTTLTGVGLASEAEWLVFNVGDSRVYLVESGSIRQLTHDHSEVQELIDSGALSPAEARTHPRRNVITRSLGGSRVPVPDFTRVPLAPGQTLLVCSDGLTNEVPDRDLAGVLAAGGSPSKAARGLVALADAQGGQDNSTAVVITVDQAVEVEDRG